MDIIYFLTKYYFIFMSLNLGSLINSINCNFLYILLFI